MSTHRTVSQYVAAIRAGGLAATEEALAPVLVVRSIEHDTDDDRAFQTRLLDRPRVGSILPMPRESPLLPGIVLVIAKRAGGAFSDRIGIGRAPNVDVRLPLPLVSKYHAFFSRSADGSWALTDADSRNGTSVDDTPLAPRGTAPLRDGCLVGVGPHRFAFHTAEGLRSILDRRPTPR